MSRGGKRLVGRDTSWPTKKTFTITFEVITSTEMVQVRDALEQGAGLLYTYVDYDGDTNTGYILSSDLDTVTGKDTLSYSFSIIFQVKEEYECFITTESEEVLLTEAGELYIKETCND